MRKVSPAMVVAVVALFVALGGVGVAATGSYVNIVDKSDSARVARVTSAGALRVESQVGAPSASNYWRVLSTPGWASMASSTGATRLAISDFSLTAEGPQGDQTAIFMSYVIPSAGSCTTPTGIRYSVMHRRVIVKNQSTVQLTFPAPLYAPYSGGSSYVTCLGVRLVSAPSGSVLYAAATILRSD